MARTEASSRDLARRLVAHLAPHVPPNVGLAAEGGWVVVTIDAVEDSRCGAALVLDDEDGRSVDEAAAAATRAVLGHLQDRLALATAERWPPSIAHVLALPDARVEGGVVRAWFGDPAHPALMIGPFVLTASR